MQKEKRNLEEFLLTNGFEIYSHSDSTKIYVKHITNKQNLYVRINTVTNVIAKVEYEVLGLITSYNDSVDFETIDTLEKLEHLVEAFK